MSRILSPGTTASQLATLIDQFCDKAMQELLETVAAHLTVPGARIAVIGYYPILSFQSGQTPIQFQSLLEIHGIATSSVIASNQFSLIDLVPQVVNNCLEFWQKSNVALQTAVDAANAKLGRTVCVFVRLPFTEENALWAPHSLLWELTQLLLPEDEVSGPREAVCQILYGDVVHIPQWVQCVRASLGHPRVEGAARIAAAVLAALS